MTTLIPIPLSYQLECRSTDTSKDAKLVNAYIERSLNVQGQQVMRVIKRPGIDAGTFYEAGVAQGIVNYLGTLRVIANNKFFKNPTTSVAIDFSSEPQIDFALSPLVMKNTQVMWVYDGNTDTLTQVTDVNYPATTVPGIVQLNDTFYVMTPDGEIRGSDTGDPFTWNVLNSIFAQAEKDTAVALAKYMSFVVALKDSTTEFFYDAEIPAPASPLRRADNMMLLVGCAAATSVSVSDNTLIWVAKAKEEKIGSSAKRIVMRMNGTTPERISTPFVERLLSAASMADSNVYSMVLGHNGHSFYVLTLVDLNISLVCDLELGFWYFWSSEVPEFLSEVTKLELSSDGMTVTVTAPAHGVSDGDVVLVSGASPTGYNGTFNATYVDANTFTYQTTGISDSPATGTISIIKWVENKLRFVHHTTVGNTNYVLDQSTGYVYALTESQYSDNGSYINFMVQTPNLDGTTNQNKHVSHVDLIGDRVDGYALIRRSDDDYQTFSKYRKAYMGSGRTHIPTRWRARRIAVNVRVTDNVPVRFERIDITLIETLR